MAANAIILLFALVALMLIRYVVIPAEETELMRRFGGKYEGYMMRTGRLLPGQRGIHSRAES